MIDIEAIFKCKIPNGVKLLDYGFTLIGEDYYKTISLPTGQFVMSVTVAGSGSVNFKLIESESEEEYILIHLKDAQGNFIGDIRQNCENILRDISLKCFDTEIFKYEQTKRVLSYMKDTYALEPEFLWEERSNSAIFRRPDNQKWFAVILIVDSSKLPSDSRGNIEIIDLKDFPENVEKHLGDKRFFKAYHMNKKHWYTVCLDDTVDDAELFSLIAASYERVKK